MATRYNGLPDTERAVLFALKLKMEMLSHDENESKHYLDPKSVLRQIVADCKFSRQGCVDEQAVLRAFLTR